MCLELGTWKRYESELDRIAQMGQPKELLLDIACGQLEYDSLRTSQTRLELVRCPVAYELPYSRTGATTAPRDGHPDRASD